MVLSPIHYTQCQVGWSQQCLTIYAEVISEPNRQSIATRCISRNGKKTYWHMPVSKFWLDSAKNNHWYKRSSRKLQLLNHYTAWLFPTNPSCRMPTYWWTLGEWQVSKANPLQAACMDSGSQYIQQSAKPGWITLEATPKPVLLQSYRGSAH